MSDVFISYSRLDREFVGQLREALVANAQEVWIDWESIPPSQAWWSEIQKGIAKANNFVVVLSPHSMASPICQMEIEYARQLKKRIIPVLHADYEREECLISITRRLAKKEEVTTREIWGARQPHDVFDANDSELKHINYFFFKDDADFQARFDQLFAIIRTDYAHKEQHTTLELRALEWDRRGRDVSFLLIDNELAQAQAWLAAAADKEPAVTELHRAYIEASVKRTRQLRNIRRASVVGSVVAGVALIFAVGASLLGVQATNSASLASTREAAAGTQVAVANSALTAVPPTLNAIATEVQSAQNFADSLQLAARAQDAYNNGDQPLGLALALEASRIDRAIQTERILSNLAYQPGFRRRFEGHTEPVWGVAFSPDGQAILSVSGDKTLILWDAATSNIMHRFVGHSKRVTSAVFSYNSKFILSGSDDTILIL